MLLPNRHIFQLFIKTLKIEKKDDFLLLNPILLFFQFVLTLSLTYYGCKSKLFRKRFYKSELKIFLLLFFF